MELPNFGAVLTFAADKEARDREFYEACLANPALAGLRDFLAQAVSLLKKNEKNLLRVRRENVTEMILEPIHGFTSTPYETPPAAAACLDPASAKAACLEIETKAQSFYAEAAKRVAALPEASRALLKTGQQRAALTKLIK